ncbi:hypothetical protein ACI01nite_24450 [Acetobacter cibinongensis]|uniref:Uncharacterized protein n=1 Tax=Acetobacter cibinongensis TaxID=146475 RepID=A0ABQ0V934_9PROT|nr:hypothetical protein AA0482_2046 [Acetobacter cibinongensis NRIC 0482]GEL59843.1 hypothetical protein ACI01nite_24450 [Acetobacter cibinongensis]
MVPTGRMMKSRQRDKPEFPWIEKKPPHKAQHKTPHVRIWGGLRLSHTLPNVVIQEQ